jgi:hypothetical protein
MVNPATSSKNVKSPRISIQLPQTVTVMGREITQLTLISKNTNQTNNPDFVELLQAIFMQNMQEVSRLFTKIKALNDKKVFNDFSIKINSGDFPLKFSIVAFACIRGPKELVSSLIRENSIPYSFECMGINSDCIDTNLRIHLLSYWTAKLLYTPVFTPFANEYLFKQKNAELINKVFGNLYPYKEALQVHIPVSDLCNIVMDYFVANALIDVCSDPRIDKTNRAFIAESQLANSKAIETKVELKEKKLNEKIRQLQDEIEKLEKDEVTNKNDLIEASLQFLALSGNLSVFKNRSLKCIEFLKKAGISNTLSIEEKYKRLVDEIYSTVD